MRLDIFFVFIVGFSLPNTSIGQIIKGSLIKMKSKEIELHGFQGTQSYLIAKTNTDLKGNFKLFYSKTNYGMGYLISADESPFLIVLSGEDIELVGQALNERENINITKGKENIWFEQYAKEQPIREQALNAWIYLDRLYTQNPTLNETNKIQNIIFNEKQRILTSEESFRKQLPLESYVSWFLPTRKLISSVPNIVKFRPEDILSTLSEFRSFNYSDSRLLSSGLFKDAIESHFWLIENSGLPLEVVISEMKKSIDIMIENLSTDELMFNEVTNVLFDLLERHSLFEASEYLALKALNESRCTLNADLSKQLESYRAMKKGNIAPNIEFDGLAHASGKRIDSLNSLFEIKSPYTLIVFGASWCPKCSDEMPLLHEYYSKWRKKGVEVIYISIETEKNQLTEGIYKHPFVTFIDYNGWDGKPVKNYYINATPTYYLLDQKKKILMRPNSINQLDILFDAYLKIE